MREESSPIRQTGCARPRWCGGWCAISSGAIPARSRWRLSAWAIAGGSTALRAWLMEPVLDRIFVDRDASLLLLIAGAALALAIVKGVADYGESVLMTRVGQRVITDVQTALYARLIRADLAYFNANPSGTLISRFINDVVLLRNAAANVLAGDRQGRGHGRVPGRR